jgi:hypothetical protein
MAKARLIRACIALASLAAAALAAGDVIGPK